MAVCRAQSSVFKLMIRDSVNHETRWRSNGIAVKNRILPRSEVRSNPRAYGDNFPAVPMLERRS